MKSVSFKAGTVFPFSAHQHRVNRYALNMKLFRGQYKDLFDQFNFNPNDSLYVSLNLAGIICKRSTDMLFGESVSVNAGKKDNSEQQKAIDRITADNFMDMLNYDSGLSASIKGDSFYKVRWGQEWDGELPQELDPSHVIVESVPAEHCFPVASQFNKKKIMEIHVCVPVQYEDSNKWYLAVESHSAGFIKYHNYELEPITTDIYGLPVTWNIGSPIGDVYEEFTGINMPLIVHVPNLTTDSWEGQDDLTEHRSVFDEINNRLSQIASILDKHADPAMAVPAGVLEVDSNGNPVFSVNREKVFEIMGKDDILPQYVTWNGQLQHAYSELDKLIKYLLMTAEIPEVALGQSDTGTSGSSGTAIRMRMSPLLAKVNRKKQYFDKGLKQVYLVAQQLELVASTEYDYEPVTPILQFNDGLPKDAMEEAQIAAIRTGSKPTQSQKSAIMELDGMTEEQAEAEIDRINSETEEEVDGDPDMFNKLTGLATETVELKEDEKEDIDEPVPIDEEA